MTTAEYLFHGVFFFLIFGVPVAVAWLSYSDRSFARHFDVSVLWTHNNRPDKLAVILLGTWWIHSCSVILWTLSRTVTTTDFITYMGWGLPIIARMFAPSDGPPAPPAQP